MKRCNICLEVKPLSDFRSDRSRRDGLQYRCRRCDGHIRMANERRYPEKRRARLQVKNALHRGKLTRKPCERCGHVNVEAHHDDYSKPLAVRWLCRDHHREHHYALTNETK